MRAMYEKRFVLSLVSMNKHELDLDCNKVKTKNGKIIRGGINSRVVVELLEIFLVLEIEFLIFVLGCGWWKDSKKTFICSCRVWGGWVVWLVVGGPSNFIVNQSPNVWIFGF